MLSDRLRAATKRQHLALHGLIDLDSIVESVDGYAKSLENFLEIITPLESKLLELFRILPHRFPPCSDERLSKSEWLRRDLCLLERPTRPPLIQLNLPQRFVADDEYLAETIAGTMYVLEGMSLGGLHIRKAVTARACLSLCEAVNFFSGYGKRTQYLWTSFIDWVNSEDLCTEAVELSSQQTFACFVEFWQQYPTNQAGLAR